MKLFIVAAIALLSACSFQGPKPGGDVTFVPGYDYDNERTEISEPPPGDSYGAGLVPQRLERDDFSAR
jgi:hypothetical protein